MLITKADVAAARQHLFARARTRVEDRLDVRVRPISEDWRLMAKMPAYRTAVANVAYIWRDSDIDDRFGPMPARFAERSYELQASGLMLPTTAPVWATERYRLWQEADAATVATGDSTAIAAWHVILEIPTSIARAYWERLVIGFVERELANHGAAIAWAIHALEGTDGWIVQPHAHLVVTARHWRRDRRHGLRHPNWIGSWQAQQRLKFSWWRRCGTGMPTWWV